MKLGPFLLLLFCCLAFSVGAQDYSPTEFVENKGQWDNSVRFKADVPAGALFVHADGLTVLQHHPDDWTQVRGIAHGHKDDGTPLPRDERVMVRSHAYRVQFAGASPRAEVIPDKPLDSYNNYFIGNDPSRWAAGCKIYQGVTIKNLYPNIDLRYYTNNGRVKYDLIVHPGGKVSDIAMTYRGVNGLQVASQQLVIHTAVGALKELAPYSYQYTDKGKKEIGAQYRVQDSTVRFDIKNYDHQTTLVIDPTLVFVSFSGSRAETWGYTATYGPDGSFYGGGIVFDSGFPVSPGAFQQNWGGSRDSRGFDIGIVKLNASGTRRLYATYIGSTGNEQPHSLVCDAQGNLVLAGRSNSEKYPVTGTGLFGVGGGYDIVVTKLSADGTTLMGSKRIGGNGDDGVNISYGHKAASSLEQNYGDDARSEVILDGAGNIYVASCTRSTNFPKVNSFQSGLKGGQDAVVLQLTPDVSALQYSTYMGGSGNDAAYVLALDPFSARVFVAGGTESDDFPGARSGPMGGSFNGVIDGFVSIVSTGGGVPSSIYLGTGATDQVYGIQFDKYGYPYVAGQTTGSWPLKKADPALPFYADAKGKQFICKLEKDLSGFVYSTVFGTGGSVPDISLTAFSVDKCENVYVSGWGGQTPGFASSGTTGLKLKNPVVKNRTDGKDFYFFVLKRDATDQLYGDFFGQDGGQFPDHVDGGTSRFDKRGVIYQAICANCDGPSVPFPTSPGAAESFNRSGRCDLAMAKVFFNLAGATVGPQASINGVVNDTAGCVPVTVHFKDTIRNTISPDAFYEWDFGDGAPRVTTKAPDTQHTYDRVGLFRVMVIVTDPESCNIKDTAYLNIKVGQNEARLSFNPEILLPCTSLKYRFNNTTTATNPLFGPQSFVWDFGDGSPRQAAGNGPVDHQYTAPGTYRVKMVLVDTSFCNAPDSVEQAISVGQLPEAGFQAPETACAPAAALFINTSQAGLRFIWNFGDGTPPLETSADSVEHVFTQPGTYTVTLRSIIPDPCYVEDTATAVITVFSKPVADFTASPQPPQLNYPITFTNLSLNASRYKWVFGDGDSLVTTSSQPIFHDYNLTGTYQACLVAYNQNGCTDTLCKPVEVIVSAGVDVPNAFTPLSGDINSTLMVRGYGIARMRFVIWNRWGQKVFETNRRLEGWDGRYKGDLQPMDVYAYTLEVEFVDGQKLTKTGDITLIR